MTRTGGAEEYVKIRNNKANTAFIQLCRVWKATETTIQRNKTENFSNIKSVLLYGRETQKVIHRIAMNLQTCVNRCLRKTFKICWRNVVSKEQLSMRAQGTPVAVQTKLRNWKSNGHNWGTISPVLSWNPQGQHRRGRPLKSWRKTTKEDTEILGKTCRVSRQTCEYMLLHYIGLVRSFVS